MRLSDALDGYWLTKRRNLSDATIADYTLTFDRLVAFLDDAEFDAIASADLNRFLLQYSYLADKSVLNMWIALSALWTWAERELGTPHIVRRGVDKPRPAEREIRPYTEAEIRALFDAVRTDRDRAILIVLLDCGIRASELCNLDVADYDRKAGSLRIRQGKGGKSRTVHLGDSSRKALWRYLLSRADGPLFLSNDSTRLTRSGVRQLVLRIAKRARVDGANVHRFRHTFAITFLRNGGNLFALQSMLGHSTLDMVRHYARLADLDVATAQRIASPADNWRL